MTQAPYSSEFLRVGFTECLAASKSNIAVMMMLYKYKVGDVDPPVELEMWANVQRDGRPTNIGGALCSMPQSLADAHY